MKRLFISIIALSIVIIGAVALYLWDTSDKEPTIPDYDTFTKEDWTMEILGYLHQLISSTRNQADSHIGSPTYGDASVPIYLYNHETLERLKNYVIKSYFISDVASVSNFSAVPPYVSVGDNLIGCYREFLYTSLDGSKVICVEFSNDDASEFYEYLMGIPKEEVWKKEAIAYLDQVIASTPDRSDIYILNKKRIELYSHDTLEKLKSYIENAERVYDLTGAGRIPSPNTLGYTPVYINGICVGTYWYFNYYSPNDDTAFDFYLSEKDKEEFREYLNRIRESIDKSFSAPSIEVSYGDIEMFINGEQLMPKDVAGNVIKPFVYEETIFVPIRTISEALGIDIEWDNSAKAVVIGDEIFVSNGQIYVTSSKFIQPESIARLGRYMLFEDAIKLLGYPHMPYDNSLHMDLYHLADERELVVQYDENRRIVERAFVINTDGTQEYIID